MKNLLLFIIASLIFVSCDKSEDLSSGGTLKVTASSGTSKNYIYKLALEAGCFSGSIKEETDTTYYFSIVAFEVGGNTSITAKIPKIQTAGKVYTYLKNSRVGLFIEFKDWIEADYTNRTKTTIEFSKFQYPGRITGVAINYDKDGKILDKGEFDFVSVKPSV